jgi:ABC-2 type transport system permease protein
MPGHIIGVVERPQTWLAVMRDEAPKILAFLRRDFLIALSYRAAFVSAIAAILVQAVVFYYVGRMVDPDVLPRYGGGEVTYMEFVVIGMALGTFLALGLGQVASALRTEQLTGTLESVLMTPTSPSTIQIGSVAYQLLFMPLRTFVFIALISVLFGLHYTWAGLGPALVVVLCFLPFVWGLGLVGAASIVTFKRGGAGVGLGAGVLTLISGVYFPLTLFPGWLQTAAEVNPLAVAIQDVREALLGAAGWSEIAPDLLVLVPLSALSLVAGLVAFRIALRREKRLGTISLY